MSVSIQRGGERTELNEDDPMENAPAGDPQDEHDPQPGPSRKQRRPQRQWEEGDLQNTDAERFTWTAHPPVLQDLSLAACFELFFDEEVCDAIVQQIILYAGQKGQHGLQFAVADLKAFIAILVISGYNHLSRRRAYWSPEPDIHNAAISKAMSRYTFEMFLRYIHLADNTTLKPGDRYAKLRPVMDLLNKRYLQHFPSNSIYPLTTP